MRCRPIVLAGVGVLSSFIALFATALALDAQAMPEIDSVARRAAERVAKTHRQRILVFSHLSCQLDMELCSAFESSLRDNLGKLTPGLQFLKREDVIRILPSHGFIAIDIDVRDVLVPVASEAGAEIVVTESLRWRRDGYDLSSELVDAGNHKKLDQFEIKIVRPVPDFGGMPLLIKDQESGVSSIIYRGTPPRSTAVWLPQCDKCPDPSYTPAARNDGIEGNVVMLVTVNERGAAEHISVIKGLQDGLSDRAVEAVRSWHFKPAIGTDGKPFATRVPIEMTFSLHG